MREAIFCQGLSKVFSTWEHTGVRRSRKDVRAVEEFDLRVEQGERVVLMGPNGSGKSTVLRILATLLLPSGGTARVAGFDVVREPDRVRAAAGVLLGFERTLYWKLTGEENLYLFGTLYGVPGRVLRQQVPRLLDAVGLSGARRRLVEEYSTGMRQRLAIARALVHSPRVLLLDEPTGGLDPEMAVEIRSLLGDLCRRFGVTMLMTSHDMEEAASFPRVVLMEGGRVRADGPPEEVLGGHRGQGSACPRAQGDVVPDTLSGHAG
ncbi:MAG: ABC transporter ATP-binding protein [Firmicutes bacterium]|nr:ABC transporter ATP-binding protein [Bacillota bacterium]